jgi:hypothetical protein
MQIGRRPTLLGHYLTPMADQLLKLSARVEVGRDLTVATRIVYFTSAATIRQPLGLTKAQ